MEHFRIGSLSLLHWRISSRLDFEVILKRLESIQYCKESIEEREREYYREYYNESII